MNVAEKNKGGRPRREIDWAMVESLARIHCTSLEIAAVMGIPHSTLTGRPEFAEIYEKGKESGKASLRRTQFKLAEKNAAVAIWLGKNLLKQRDDRQEETDGTEETKLTFRKSNG